MRTRTTIATLFATGTLVLTGCSSAEPAEPAEPAAAVGIDATTPPADVDPLAVCEPLNSMQDGLNCVPGVGSTLKLKSRSIAPEGVTDFTKVEVPRPYKAGDRWVVMILSTYTRPSSGLTPATIGAQLEVIDLAEDKLIQTVDLGEARVNGLIPVQGKDLVVLALTDKSKLRNPVGSTNAPTPSSEITMLGVRPSTGEISWTRNDVLTSITRVPALTDTIPAYLVPKTAADCTTTSNPATEVFGLDASTGVAKWSIDLSTLPGPRDNTKTCTADEVIAAVNLPAIQIVREAVPDVGTFYGDANYNLRTNVLVETGQPLRGFEHSKITANAHDPVGTLAKFVADKGAGTDSATYVVDRVSGEVKATVDTAAISAVGGKIRGLFDGIFYVKNGDELFTLDALTGEEKGHVQAVPSIEINGWILHEDGTFTKSE